MNKTIICILLALGSALSVFGQASGGNRGSGTGIAITTVAGLATVPGRVNGTVAVVTNGNSASDCTAGGGSTVVTCQFNGSTWAQLVAASSGSTAFAALTPGTNTAALVMGTGGSLATSGTGTITATALTGTPSITVNGLTASTETFSAVPTLPSQTQNLFFASPNGSSGVPTFRSVVAADIPTLNQSTTGSAATWTTPRNLAGNSVNGSANVPFANAFIVQGTVDAGLTGAQFLGALGTGIVRNTTTTGVLTSSEMSGDCTTSGSNAIICTKANGVLTTTHGTGSLTANNFLSGNGTADIKLADANGVTYAMGAITTDVNPFALTWTTNNAATTFSGLKFVTTNTAQHAGSLNYQFCGGANCLTIDPSANLVTPGSGTFSAGASTAGAIWLGGGTQASLTTNSLGLSTQGSSVMTNYNLNFPAAAASGILNWTNTSNQVNAAFLTSAANGDVIVGNGSGWSKFAGNASGTKVLTEDASGNVSWGAGGSGASGAVTILTKTANYTTVAADFSSATTAATEVIYAVTTSTVVTHTLPSAMTSIASGAYQIVKNSCTSTFALYITPATLTLDGDTTSMVLPPCREVTITSDATNWRSNLGQVRTASIGGRFIPDTPYAPLAASTLTANQQVTFQFVLTTPVKVANFTVDIATGAAGTGDVGIYDVGGNLLSHVSGGFSTAGSAALKSSASTVLTLAPGTYYASICSSSATPSIWGTTIGAATQFIQAGATGTVGTATACTAGVLPATQGAVTNSTGPNIGPAFWVNP